MPSSLANWRLRCEYVHARRELVFDGQCPLYAHVRHKGYGPEDAADLKQECFASLLANSLA